MVILVYRFRLICKKVRQMAAGLPCHLLIPLLFCGMATDSKSVRTGCGSEAWMELFSPMTPYGKPMSVRMTSAGKYGWFSDRKGYRYVPQHPSGVGADHYQHSRYGGIQFCSSSEYPFIAGCQAPRGMSRRRHCKSENPGPPPPTRITTG